MRNSYANISVIWAKRGAGTAIKINAEMPHLSAQLEPKAKALATTYFTVDRSKDTLIIGQDADLDRCRKSRPTESQAAQLVRLTPLSGTNSDNRTIRRHWPTYPGFLWRNRWRHGVHAIVRMERP